MVDRLDEPGYVRAAGHVVEPDFRSRESVYPANLLSASPPYPAELLGGLEYRAEVQRRDGAGGYVGVYAVLTVVNRGDTSAPMDMSTLRPVLRAYAYGARRRRGALRWQGTGAEFPAAVNRGETLLPTGTADDVDALLDVAAPTRRTGTGVDGTRPLNEGVYEFVIAVRFAGREIELPAGVLDLRTAPTDGATHP